jgi:hypothetical protein
VGLLKSGGKALGDLVADLVSRGFPESTAQKIASGELPMDEASQMARAREQGYSKEGADAYRGRHTAPTSADDVGAPAYQMDRTYPEDIYSPDGARYYGDRVSAAEDEAVMRNIRAVRGNPDATMTIYRSVPTGAPDRIQHGDWVTPQRSYAVRHAESEMPEGYKILQDEVPARTLFTEGNSLFEFGYDASQSFADGPASLPVMRSSVAGSPERSAISAAFDPEQIGNPNLLASAAGTTTALAALLPSEDAEAGVVSTALKARPVLPTNQRVSTPMGQFTPTPINKPLYRETNSDGLGSLLDLSFGNTEGAPGYQQFFVSDTPDLAIGQGNNKGVMVRMRGDAVSGREHQKPGTGDIAGREYVTDIIGKDFIDEVMLTPDAFKKIRPMSKTWLVRNFDGERLPDGRVRYKRKDYETGTPLTSLASAGVIGATMAGQSEDSEASALNQLIPTQPTPVTDFAQRQQRHRDQFKAMRASLGDLIGGAGNRLAEVAALLDRPAGVALRALDMPAQGIMGMTRVAGGLAAGEGLDQALNQGANVARADPMDTATALGGLVVDEVAQTPLAPIAPALGTATMMGALALSPI